jgi:DNA-binding response OmpR family regulator
MQNKPLVLVIDDEKKILDLVKSYLEISGFTALCAKSAGEGMRLFEDAGSKNRVSLILLDLMLPDYPGEEFIKKIREFSDIPVIMITAKVEEEDIIRGLNMGADDYVCKPFSPRQLVARVQAALRRRGGGGEADQFLVYRDLTADTGKRSVSRGGKTIALTKDEYNILTLLMSRQEKIFTRDEILARIKGEDYDGFDRSVDTHIKNLRAKIGDEPRSPKYITTVYGMGYRLGENS